MRWLLLGLAAVIVVLWASGLILTLRHQLQAADMRAGAAERRAQADETALAVAKAEAKLKDDALANLHVTVTAPAPQITVTAPPTKDPAVVTVPGATRIVPVPSPFPISSPASSPPPTPHPAPSCLLTGSPLLGICL